MMLRIDVFPAPLLPINRTFFFDMVATPPAPFPIYVHATRPWTLLVASRSAVCGRWCEWASFFFCLSQALSLHILSLCRRLIHPLALAIFDSCGFIV